MDKRKEIKQETEDNFFYSEFARMLSQTNTIKYSNDEKKVIPILIKTIELLTEAIDYYQNTNVLKNNSVTLITPQYERDILPKNKDELYKIILSLARELDKGYDVYSLVSERIEPDEIDEDLTIEAGRKIGLAKNILQEIIIKEQKERERMSNPRADERRRNYR